VEKLVEKNPPTPIIERMMMKYKNLIQELDEMPKDRNAFFINVYFGNVISVFKNQA